MTTKYLRFNPLLKAVILISCLLFLVLKLSADKSDLLSLYALFKIKLIPGYAAILVMIILMPLNWSFEAWKWQLLAGKVVKLSFWDSLKGVITGLGLSFVTPYALGDYLGRIGLISHTDRKRLVGPLLMGSSVQLFVTLVFGLLGVFYLFDTDHLFYLLFLVISFFMAFVFIYRMPKSKWNSKMVTQIKFYFGLAQAFNRRELVKVFAISFLRYLTFGFQFLLALHIFLPHVEPHLKLAGITWVFLAKSMVPTFNFLSDLGVREVSAVLFFEQHSIDMEPVLLSSLLIWLINLLLPTVLSLPLIFKLKIMR
ncbi:MAG: lysylphosphatidylglycerol synthase domain-containing protein [Bacteroidota bacterium]